MSHELFRIVVASAWGGPRVHALLSEVLRAHQVLAAVDVSEVAGDDAAGPVAAEGAVADGAREDALEEATEVLYRVAVTADGVVLRVDDAGEAVAGPTVGALAAALAERELETTLETDAAHEYDDGAGEDDRDAEHVASFGAFGDEDDEDDDLERDPAEIGRELPGGGWVLGGEDVDVDELPDIDGDAQLRSRSALFSRRGPGYAHGIAWMTGSTVDYGESAGWSVFRFDDPLAVDLPSASRAELPSIHLAAYDEASPYVRVVTTAVSPLREAKGELREFLLLPAGELFFQPVHDLDVVAESARDVYASLLNLERADAQVYELAAERGIDAEALLAALDAPALGGASEVPVRVAAVLDALGVPRDLIDPVLAERPLPSARQVPWTGPVSALDDLLVEGGDSLRPLSRRGTWWARAERWVLARPIAGAVMVAAEAAAGATLLSSRRGWARAVGVFLVIDAAVEAFLIARRRTRR